MTTPIFTIAQAERVLEIKKKAGNESPPFWSARQEELVASFAGLDSHLSTRHRRGAEVAKAAQENF